MGEASMRKWIYDRNPLAGLKPDPRAPRNDCWHGLTPERCAECQRDRREGERDALLALARTVKTPEAEALVKKIDAAEAAWSARHG